MPKRFLPNVPMPPEGATEIFEMQRPMLLRLAYRMLGSHGEAEDVVQEAWVRWQATDHAQLSQPAAWLSTVVSRLCLDIMKSARNRREVYSGPWLPEPLVEEESDDIRPDNLTLSLMLALERLSPLERAAFLLHDVFGQPLDQVAQTIDRSPAATRQLARRARAHVHVDRPRYTVPRETGERVARAFFDACKTGDSSALSTILSEGARLYSDGGGKVRNVLNIIYGKDNLVRMFKSLSRKRGDEMEYIHFTMIDGLPGFIWRLGGAIQTTAIEMDTTQITAIYITRNPDKLSKIRLN